MYKIINSIKSKPLNMYIIVICICIYLVNEMFFKNFTKGLLNYISICYFNDFMAPIIFLSYMNIILLTRRQEVKKITTIILVCIINGVLWEYGADLVKDGSVIDLYDFIAYLLGGIVYWKFNTI